MPIFPPLVRQTIERAHAAGLAGVAVEADRAFVLEFDKTIDRADELGLFVLGLRQGLTDMTSGRPIKVAIVAGEESGDLLGADLLRALESVSGRDID